MREIRLNKTNMSNIDMGELMIDLNPEEVKKWKGPHNIGSGWSAFTDPPGKNHYRLLSSLSEFYENETICDIGTLVGASALALSYNSKNDIFTFDLEKKTFSAAGKTWTEDDPQFETIDLKRPNISYMIGNCLDHGDILLKSSLIFLDIDHSGVVERKIIDFLIENDWGGIMVLDDIHWPELSTVFNEYKKNKKLKVYDITKYGHVSEGTGLINFSDKNKIIMS